MNVVNVSDRTFLMHLGGKIEVNGRVAVKTRDDLSMAYTPGVARVCMAIHDEPEKVYNLTIKQNTVAVVTDGSAVLGLGDIGPAAALPVMEGKCLIFKAFAGVDAFPIALDTKDVDEIVRTVKNIAPVFGGINLEDIAAPRCFEIEERLQRELDIPVFHDDQHGTAVVTLAALINALKIVNKKLNEVKIVFTGAGASAIATAKLLMLEGARHILGVGPRGHALPRPHREHELDEAVVRRAHESRQHPRHGERHAGRRRRLHRALGPRRRDGGRPRQDEPRSRSSSPWRIPTPEIMPEEAARYVRVMATGRSDYPNQINNSCGFPGFFRGMFDVRARRVNDEMKLAAAHALASIVSDSEICEEYITPSMFDPRVVPAVASAVADAAVRTGVARRKRS